jgi:hypothetical protein
LSLLRESLSGVIPFAGGRRIARVVSSKLDNRFAEVGTMDKVILDAATLARLSQSHQEVAVCDETGREVGRFVPAVSRTRTDRVPEISEEELDQIERKCGGVGRSLDEILRDLVRPA